MRYITKKEDLAKFQVNILQTAETRVTQQNAESRAVHLDDTLALRISEDAAIEKHIDEFSEALMIACNKSFKTKRASKKATTHKPVPWWTEELTILRKRTNTTEEIRDERGTTKNRGRGKGRIIQREN